MQHFDYQKSDFTMISTQIYQFEWCRNRTLMGGPGIQLMYSHLGIVLLSEIFQEPLVVAISLLSMVNHFYIVY